MTDQILLQGITLEELNAKIQEGISTQLKQLQNKETSTNELISGKDIQSEMGVCHATIHNWKKKAILKPIYIGGKVYFKRSELPHNKKVKS